MTQFWFAASTEQFTPTEMLEQATAAESAGFEALASSDHFAPWWPEGKASFAWTTLAAIGQHTTKPIGTSVTPVVHDYHPGVIAQAFMGLEELYPGRVFLGVGSGESVNEVPLGADPEDQINRIRETEESGATVVCLQCIGADPIGSIERYGQHVLPALTGARV